ncbi:MAG: hypothetical protein H7A00_03730 [Hahellaceae bacterium]|nr:hypothetical protein [Hahellaceae bacterium]
MIVRGLEALTSELADEKVSDKAEEMQGMMNSEALANVYTTSKLNGDKRGVTEHEVNQAIEKFKQDYPSAEKLDFLQFETKYDAWGDKAPEGRVSETILSARKVRSGVAAIGRDTVVIIRDAHDDMPDITKTLRHEVLAHYGLGTLHSISQQKYILESINASRPTQRRQDTPLTPLDRAWKYVLDTYADEPELVQAEELLAYITESRPSFIARTAGDFITWLVKLLV